MSSYHPLLSLCPYAIWCFHTCILTTWFCQGHMYICDWNMLHVLMAHLSPLFVPPFGMLMSGFAVVATGSITCVLYLQIKPCLCGIAHMLQDFEWLHDPFFHVRHEQALQQIPKIHWHKWQVNVVDDSILTSLKVMITTNPISMSAETSNCVATTSKLQWYSTNYIDCMHLYICMAQLVSVHRRTASQISICIFFT